MKLPRSFPAQVNPSRLLFAVMFGAALGASAVACSSSLGGEPPCLPPAYSVSPTSARPGEMVTVAAPPADCNPRYGANAQIRVSITDNSGAEVFNTIVPMTNSGEFTYTFTVPPEVAVGEAAVTAMPHNIDWCDDTGRNNRAAGTTNFMRASCAIPVETLTITR